MKLIWKCRKLCYIRQCTPQRRHDSELGTQLSTHIRKRAPTFRQHPFQEEI